MYGIVCFTDFSSLSLTVYKQQLQIVQFWAKLASTWLVLLIFTVNVLFHDAIIYWTGYSCQNKRQNALFWARKRISHCPKLDFWSTLFTIISGRQHN